MIREIGAWAFPGLWGVKRLGSFGSGSQDPCLELLLDPGSRQVFAHLALFACASARIDGRQPNCPVLLSGTCLEYGIPFDEFCLSRTDAASAHP